MLQCLDEFPVPSQRASLLVFRPCIPPPLAEVLQGLPPPSGHPSPLHMLFFSLLESLPSVQSSELLCVPHDPRHTHLSELVSDSHRELAGSVL